jgi:hypothetical protein
MIEVSKMVRAQFHAKAREILTAEQKAVNNPKLRLNQGMNAIATLNTLIAHGGLKVPADKIPLVLEILMVGGNTNQVANALEDAKEKSEDKGNVAERYLSMVAKQG